MVGYYPHELLVSDINSKIPEVNVIIPYFNMPKCVEVEYNGPRVTDSPLVICLPGLVPYDSDKAVPYQYNTTMMENGKEIPIPTLSAVVNIAKIGRVTQSGRVYTPLPPKQPIAPTVRQNPVDVPIENPMGIPVGNPDLNIGPSEGTNINPDFDE